MSAHALLHFSASQAYCAFGALRRARAKRPSSAPPQQAELVLSARASRLDKESLLRSHLAFTSPATIKLLNA